MYWSLVEEQSLVMGGRALNRSRRVWFIVLGFASTMPTIVEASGKSSSNSPGADLTLICEDPGSCFAAIIGGSSAGMKAAGVSTVSNAMQDGCICVRTSEIEHGLLDRLTASGTSCRAEIAIVGVDVAVDALVDALATEFVPARCDDGGGCEWVCADLCTGVSRILGIEAWRT